MRSRFAAIQGKASAAGRFDRNKKRRHPLPPVSHLHFGKRFGPREDLLGKRDFRVQPVDVPSSENTRNEHVAEQGGGDDIDEVVPGIDGGQADRMVEVIEPAGFVS